MPLTIIQSLIERFSCKRRLKKIYKLPTHNITLNLIDRRVVDIINHLKKNGFEAYLVGGCIRDLLLKRSPKDFDVVTNAKPRQIKKIFRNSRIIGRRFRLVHIFAGKKIIEVSTFRGTDKLLSSQNSFAANNVWGTMETDAFRRDFTVNSLYYDISNSTVIDYVNGMKDIKAKKLKSINDPFKTFEEDPVRIIRAARFSAMLELSLGEKEIESAKKHSFLLAKVNPSRMLEELRKILKCGASAKTFFILNSTGALNYWLSEITPAEIFDGTLKRLEILDRYINIHSMNEELIFTVFLYELLKSVTGKEGTKSYQESFVLLRQKFRELAQKLHLPRWLWFGICDIASTQHSFRRLSESYKPYRLLRRIVNGKYYQDSILFLEMENELNKNLNNLISFWKRTEEKIKKSQIQHKYYHQNIV